MSNAAHPPEERTSGSAGVSFLGVRAIDVAGSWVRNTLVKWKTDD
jgi:hypothetical protein